jgi:hypothetical protein
MLKSQQKEKLNRFFEAVNLVSHPRGIGTKEEVFDLGLIILEKDTKVTLEDIQKELQKVKFEFLEYDEKVFWEEFLKKIVDALEKEKWILFNIKADPDHYFLNALKTLSEGNFIQALNFRGKEIFNFKLPLKSRIVCVIEREFLEKKLSYPYFLNIFGPIISL